MVVLSDLGQTDCGAGERIVVTTTDQFEGRQVDLVSMSRGSAGDLMRRLQTRALRMYLGATTALYIAAVVLTVFPTGDEADLPNPTGCIIAIVLGLGALIYLATTPERLGPAAGAAMIATPVAMAFHVLIIAEYTCLVAVMFLAMYLRAFNERRRAWLLVGTLTALTVAAVAVAPAPTFGFLYVIVVVAIVGAAESFGQITRGLVEIASTDPLTGLLNRAGWEIATAELLRHSRSPHRAVTVIALDIDHFKLVNDTYGHREGDAQLQRIAGAWKAMAPKNSVLARLGGDEFAACLVDISPAETDRFVSSIGAELPEVSYGVATETSARPNVSELLDQADSALYRAKDGKKR
jgi:diguanylate cyclase (GGDEF)-like protein